MGRPSWLGREYTRLCTASFGESAGELADGRAGLELARSESARERFSLRRPTSPSTPDVVPLAVSYRASLDESPEPTGDPLNPSRESGDTEQLRQGETDHRARLFPPPSQIARPSLLYNDTADSDTSSIYPLPRHTDVVAAAQGPRQRAPEQEARRARQAARGAQD